MAVVATLPAAVAAAKGWNRQSKPTTQRSLICAGRSRPSPMRGRTPLTSDRSAGRTATPGIDARTAIEAWDELAEALDDVDLELPDLELPDAN